METVIENDSSENEERSEGKNTSNTSFRTTREGANFPVIKRNAMGEYIVPKGSMPLTQQAIPLPGPADYDPKTEIASLSSPHYSIVGRTKLPQASKTPGASDYNTSGDLIWKRKTKCLKEKGRTRPYGNREDVHETCSLGSAKYNVTYWSTGKHAPSLSVASRHAEGINVGHPNQLVQPVDTHGVVTPGSNHYDPQHKADFGNSTAKSFGSSRNPKSETLGPGPAAYTIDGSKETKGYSFAKRLPAKWQKVIYTPAANSYNLGTTIGKGVAMSVRSRQPVLQKADGPSPNTYSLRDFVAFNDAPIPRVTYRPFEHSLKQWPSPAHYKPSTTDLPQAAKFSCRRDCKPCFPDILNYPVKAKCYTPGPGTYHKVKKFTSNDSPAYSMGKRARDRKTDVPGPNHYRISLPHRPDAQKAPSFSMSKRCFPPQKQESPAPTKYQVPLDTNETPKYSMTKRPRSSKKSNIPAPNAYYITTSQTNRGTHPGTIVTLKSRGTSYVYSGYALQSSVRLRDT
ncbi:hypothetical protein HOLleu_04900 [Holothuria leucospilota]|uniref:Outer dense fiber protein 3 n=1 Tax=Holothuria leucospilota TaxID=206669 RepID=A0A9Q1CKT0_HOLLE|nr:hypothetical protein HOLleu_04900 [Holothuria leucospilota]